MCEVKKHNVPSAPVFEASQAGRQVKYPAVAISINIHWSYLFYSHGEKGSLFRADFADSWYSVARDLPWCWWWEWVSVTSASNLMSIHILSYATSTTTNDGAQLILQRIDRGEC